MPESIRIDREHGVILIESSNRVEEEDLFQSLKSVLHISHQHGFVKVMVDATSQRDLPSMMALFRFASKLHSCAMHLKHAIVVSEDTPENTRFIETVAHNRGAIIKIFTSRDDALSWLKA